MVDVVLRPNPQRAARTVDVFEIWGGEVVLRDAAVQDVRPVVTDSGGPASR
jgi:hypothetical protein